MKIGPAVKRVFASVDWGFTNPGVIQCWVTDGDDRMYLIVEHYMSRRTIDHWITKAKEIQSQHSPEVFICDPSEPGYIQQFRAAAIQAMPANNNIGLGIQSVQKRLRDAGDGRRRLFVLENALQERDTDLHDAHKPVCTAEEFDAYVYPKGVDGRPLKEVPLDLNNHGMDAMRYAVAYVDLTPKLVMRGA